ncbi:unnamed protein product [Amoebophrya sp. A120]|nr:unnamed protein product [Amoebophrya sp. A120]|eukprot:GSA120T00001223001.1
MRVASLAKGLFDKQQRKLQRQKKAETSTIDVLQDEFGLETIEIPKDFYDLLGLATRFTTVAEEAEEQSELPPILDRNRKGYIPVLAPVHSKGGLYSYARPSAEANGAGSQVIQSAMFCFGQRTIVPDVLTIDELTDAPTELYDHLRQEHVDFATFLDRYYLKRTHGFDPPKDDLMELSPHPVPASNDQAAEEALLEVDEEELKKRKLYHVKPNKTPEGFLHFEIWKPVAKIRFRAPGEVIDYRKEIVYQSSHTVKEVYLGYKLEVKDFDITTNVPLNLEELVGASGGQVFDLAGLKEHGSTVVDGVVSQGQKASSASSSRASSKSKLAGFEEDEGEFVLLLRKLLHSFLARDAVSLATLDVVECKMHGTEELRKELFTDMDGRTCRNGHLMTPIPCKELCWTRPAPCIECKELTTYKVITCRKRCEMAGYCIGCEADDAFKADLKSYVEEKEEQERLKKRIDRVEEADHKQMRILGKPLSYNHPNLFRDTQLFLRFLLVTKLPYADWLQDPWAFEAKVLQNLSEVMQLGGPDASNSGKIHPQVIILSCTGQPVVADILLLHPKIASQLIPRTRHFRRHEGHELYADQIESGTNFGAGGIVRLDEKYETLLKYLKNMGAAGGTSGTRSWVRSQVVGMTVTRGKIDACFPIRNDKLTYNFKTRLRYVQCPLCTEEGFQDCRLAEHKETSCSMRQVTCSLDCGMVLLARDLNEHICKACVNREVFCPLCNAVVIYHDLDSHMAQCEYRPWTCGKCGLSMKVKDIENHERILCVNREVVCNWCGEWTIFRKLIPEHKKLKCVRRHDKAEQLRNCIFNGDHGGIADLLEDGVAPTLDAHDPKLLELGCVSCEGIAYEDNSTNLNSMSVITTETNVPLVSRPATRDTKTRVHLSSTTSAANREGVSSNSPEPKQAAAAEQGTKASPPSRSPRPESRENLSPKVHGKSPTSPKLPGGKIVGAILEEGQGTTTATGKIKTSPPAGRNRNQAAVVGEDYQQWFDDGPNSFNAGIKTAEHHGHDPQQQTSTGIDLPMNQNGGPQGLIDRDRYNNSLSQWSRIPERADKDEKMLTQAFDDEGLPLPIRHWTRGGDFEFHVKGAGAAGLQPSMSEEFPSAFFNEGTNSPIVSPTGAAGPPGGGGPGNNRLAVDMSVLNAQHDSSIANQTNEPSFTQQSLALMQDPTVALDIKEIDASSHIETVPGPNLYLGLGLHCAVQSGDLEAVKILCGYPEIPIGGAAASSSKSIDLFLRDNFGCTCLHLAAMKGRLDMVDFLLQVEYQQKVTEEREKAARMAGMLTLGGNKGGDLSDGIRRRTYVNTGVSVHEDKTFASTMTRTSKGAGGAQQDSTAPHGGSPPPGSGSSPGNMMNHGSGLQTEFMDISKLLLPRVVDHEGRTPLFVSAFHRRRDVADRLYAITYEQESNAPAIPVANAQALSAGVSQPGPALQKARSDRKKKVQMAQQPEDIQVPVTVGAVIPPAHLLEQQREEMASRELQEEDHSQFFDPQSEVYDMRKRELLESRQSDPGYWDVVTEQDVLIESSTRWQTQFYLPRHTSDTLGLNEYQNMKGTAVPLPVPAGQLTAEQSGSGSGSGVAVGGGNVIIPAGGSATSLPLGGTSSMMSSGTANVRYGSDALLGEHKSKHERSRREMILHESLRDTLGNTRYNSFLDQELSRSTMKNDDESIEDPFPNTHELLAVHVNSGRVPLSAASYQPRPQSRPPSSF